ncbi:hypothetical protein YPPY66_1131 [Yersinia pestis PY-66]|uniref:Uncharacterized protein n=2 Tax=Yersinia pestis TaxID=632 RepID=A0AAV3BFT9_YERPE|nr:hypothetical protein YpAngola_A3378 [Yersinia pestis Angola]ADV97667.1 hypothetical protein YPC_0989 [Yersinia pestis biovar Medievalis str. Harbin 35]EDR33342.1 hypothetical protein YPIP275_4306 [Yersinia pestis biovar Orientalis str. IP275]EDR40355.1 hypothetical protein YpF1991016_1262 [Yersinia pestis biovar Orientalis str. F1991016]EDR43026.1 hypothetical protein YpE1979001_3376 [Yersinia pestis biovar Antiqua str. E1979001]EDR50442.1 hypothetical protein YpB42003004_3138 [Yersinia pes
MIFDLLTNIIIVIDYLLKAIILFVMRSQSSGWYFVKINCFMC